MYISAPAINEPVLRALGERTGGPVDQTVDPVVPRRRSRTLNNLIAESQNLFVTYKANGQLGNALTQIREIIRGDTPDFSGVSSEALGAADLLMEAQRDRPRPDPGAVRGFAGAFQRLAESTGELTPEQSNALTVARQRSADLQQAAVGTARQNLSTSRLRPSSDPSTDSAVRFLRSLCGDTATANVLCAPMDVGVTGVDGATGQPSKRMPPGVFPDDIRHVAGNRLYEVGHILSGTGTPLDILELETTIQEVNVMVTSAQQEQGITAPNELPNASERRRLLQEAMDARVHAIRVARDHPGGPVAAGAYQDYVDTVDRLREAMGIVPGEGRPVVPARTGEEVPHVGDPRVDLVRSETAIGEALLALTRYVSTGEELLQILTGRPAPVLSTTAGAASTPPDDADSTVEDAADDRASSAPSGSQVALGQAEDQPSEVAPVVTPAPEGTSSSEPAVGVESDDVVEPRTSGGQTIAPPLVDRQLGGLFDPNAGAETTDVLPDGWGVVPHPPRDPLDLGMPVTPPWDDVEPWNDPLVLPTPDVLAEILRDGLFTTPVGENDLVERPVTQRTPQPAPVPGTGAAAVQPRPDPLEQASDLFPRAGGVFRVPGGDVAATGGMEPVSGSVGVSTSPLEGSGSTSVSEGWVTVAPASVPPVSGPVELSGGPLTFPQVAAGTEPVPGPPPVASMPSFTMPTVSPVRPAFEVPALPTLPLPTLPAAVSGPAPFRAPGTVPGTVPARQPVVQQPGVVELELTGPDGEDIEVVEQPVVQQPGWGQQVVDRAEQFFTGPASIARRADGGFDAGWLDGTRGSYDARGRRVSGNGLETIPGWILATVGPSINDVLGGAGEVFKVLAVPAKAAGGFLGGAAQRVFTGSH